MHASVELARSNCSIFSALGRCNLKRCCSRPVLEIAPAHSHAKQISVSRRCGNDARPMSVASVHWYAYKRPEEVEERRNEIKLSRLGEKNRCARLLIGT